jgi:hypothetical protein
VTVASGLTATAISEGAYLGISLVQGAIKLGESLKGLKKIYFFQRGKHRAKAANSLVAQALKGDMDVLKFLVNSEALSKTWFAKIWAASNGGIVTNAVLKTLGAGFDIHNLSQLDLSILSSRPKNEQEMLAYLEMCQRNNLLKKLKSEVSTVMRSV